MRPRLRSATFALVTLVASAINCGRDVTSPLADGDQGVRYARGLSFAPSFPAAFSRAGSAAGGLVPFTSVKVTLRHSDGTIALDTLIAFPSDADSVQVSLSVKLLASAPASGEPMTLALNYINAGGTIVFSGGPVNITATPAVLGQTVTPPIIVPVSYTGPGAGATKVVISPKNLTVSAGGTFAFTAQALDASNNPIAGTPIIFSSSNTALAVLPNAGSGSGNALNGRGSVQITAMLLTGGLTDAATLVVQPAASAIAVVSGSGQSAIAGTPLAAPVVARVTAGDGGGVSGVAVTFAPSGGGSAGTPSVLTDANGNAQTTWTLGANPGAQTLSATAAGVATAASFTATATTPPATKLAVIQQPGSTSIGAPLSPVVIAAQDASGNTVTSFTGVITIALGANTAGASLGGTTTANAVAGLATFSGLTVSKIGSAFSLVASSGTLASATTSLFDVGAGAASELAFTTQPGNVVAGAVISPSPVVTVRDALGNTVTGFAGPVTLTLASSPANAVIGGTATVNAVAGVATFSNVSVNRAGAYQLGATASSLATATSTSFNASAGPAATVALVSGGGQTAAIGTQLPQPVLVSVSDNLGNPVLGQPVVFATVVGSGSVSPANGSTNASGQVSTTWTLGSTVGAQSLTATSGALPVLSIAATGTGAAPAGVSQIVVTQVPTSRSAGALFTVIAEARDAQNALVTSFNGAMSIAIGANPPGGTLSGTTTVNAINGVATFGGLSLNKTSSAYSLIVSGASFNSDPAPFIITPGAPTAIVLVSGGNQTGTVSTVLPQPVVVMLADQLGNPIIAQSVLFSAAPGNGSVAPTTVTSNSLGQASTMWTLGATPGPQSITAAAFNYPTTTINATATVVAPGPATTLVFSSVATSVTAGVPFSTVVVQARDANGQVATSFNGSVTLAFGANPQSGVLSGTTSVAASGGYATFNGLSITKASTGYTLVATSGALSTTPAALTVVAATASVIAFTAQPTTTGAGTIISPAVVATASDQYGNVATGFTGTVTLQLGTNPPGAVFGGQLAKAAVAGVATFSDLTVSAAGTAFTITATIPGSIATSNPFNVTGAVMGWTNPAGGSWSLASNWSLNRVPVTGDSIVITMPGTYTVTLDTTFVATFITIGGASGAQTLSINSRSLTVNNALTIAAHGTFSHYNGTLSGGGVINNQGGFFSSYATTSLPLTNGGLVQYGGAGVLSAAFVNQASGTLRIDGNNGAATLTIANGFTNQGAIQLTSTGGGYTPSLVVTNGTLTNAPGASITSMVGAGGPRNLNAALSNQGVLTLAAQLTLDKASAHHANSGTIDVTGGDLTVTQSGVSPSFVNTGTVNVPASRTFTISSGTFVQQPSGVIAGAGAMTINGVTAVFSAGFGLSQFSASGSVITLATNLQTTGLTLNLSNSTVSGTGTITNVASQIASISSTSIGLPIVNQGTIVFTGSGSFSGPYSNAAGSTLRVAGNNGQGFLSIANGFTNDGTIDLTSVGGGYTSHLDIASGTLNNSATGVIMTSVGAGGPRQLDVQLDNHGLLSVDGPLTMARTSSVHTNSGQITLGAADLALNQSGTSPSFSNTGTITIGSGRTFVAQGAGSFDQHIGATINGGGSLTLNNITATFDTGFTLSGFNATGSTIVLNTALQTTGLTTQLSSSIVNGTGSLVNVANQPMSLYATTINTPLSNSGTIVFTGSGTFNAAFSNLPNALLRVAGSNGSGVLTISNGFTNQGTIEITSIGGGYTAQLFVVNGTLINAPGATILSALGAGGPRNLNAQLTNQGTLTVAGPLTIAQPSATHVNSGIIQTSGADLTVTQFGTTPTLSNTGVISIGAGTTWTINGGQFTQQVGATLNGGGALVLNGTASGAFNTAFTLGALTLSSSIATFNVPVSTANFTLSSYQSNINGSSTFTNPFGKTTSLAYTNINAPLINQGTILFSGSGTFSNAVTNDPGAIIQVAGSNGSGDLTISNGFTNNGTLELTSIGGGYSSSLTVTNGTLSIGSGGQFLASAGAGGPRTLNANLTNNGTVNIFGNTLSISRGGGIHTNNGTFNLTSGDLSVALFSGTPSFTNNGIINVPAGRTVSFGGGTFNEQAAATLSGAGTLSISGTTANFSGNPTVANINVSGSALNLLNNFPTTGITMSINTSLVASIVGGAGSLTNAAGQTLALSSATVNVPLANQGIIEQTGTGTLGGTFTTFAGSTLRLAGNNGAADLTVSSFFQNNGLLDMTSVGGGYSATLTVTSGTFYNGASGTLQTSVGAGGPRTINATVNNLGTTTIGVGGTGLLQVNGGFSNSGTLNMKLAGPSTYDKLAVSYNLSLFGTLNVATVAYAPGSGTSFPLLTTGGAMTGTFATTNLPVGFTVPPTYSATTVTAVHP